MIFEPLIITIHCWPGACIPDRAIPNFSAADVVELNFSTEKGEGSRFGVGNSDPGATQMSSLKGN